MPELTDQVAKTIPKRSFSVIGRFGLVFLKTGSNGSAPYLVFWISLYPGRADMTKKQLNFTHFASKNKDELQVLLEPEVLQEL